MRLDWCWGGLGCKGVDLHNLHKTFDAFRWKLMRDKKTLSLCHSLPSDHLSSMWSCFHMGTKESLLESKTCLQAKTLTDGGRLTLMQFSLPGQTWLDEKKKQLVYIMKGWKGRWSFVDLFCHDYVSKENALQAFKLIICVWCCKGPSLTDVGAVTWVQLLGRKD